MDPQGAITWKSINDKRHYTKDRHITKFCSHNTIQIVSGGQQATRKGDKLDSMTV